eukprot:CAMPEP_0177540744 /NCGR_PEP_ID=MMETSP0369-20130122/59762_1 /TAXON_ID=447022 ORGANISM="Scrippsiella hangoei-like, Strain SHHI-4" /NCGR_SAMPLE_ID=MMETSP0369 /ASSEMBLY_ACC=CAM_ASM_000364 /LENGTH=189 /DNA_ID=CAMNT_0019024019 /DNA_START=53 /DNA_END=619 /DNA_ORIENTATION=-
MASTPLGSTSPTWRCTQAPVPSSASSRTPPFVCLPCGDPAGCAVRGAPSALREHLLRRGSRRHHLHPGADVGYTGLRALRVSGGLRGAAGLVEIDPDGDLILVAGLCKETGFTFFGLLVGWEALCLTRVRFSGQGGTISRCLRMVVVLVVGAAACAARLWYTQGTQIARMDPYSNPIAASDDSYVRILS